MNFDPVKNLEKLSFAKADKSTYPMETRDLPFPGASSERAKTSMFDMSIDSKPAATGDDGYRTPEKKADPDTNANDVRCPDMLFHFIRQSIWPRGWQTIEHRARFLRALLKGLTNLHPRLEQFNANHTGMHWDLTKRTISTNETRARVWDSKFIGQLSRASINRVVTNMFRAIGLDVVEGDFDIFRTRLDPKLVRMYYFPMLVRVLRGRY